MLRRQFIGFFLMGGIIGLFSRKARVFSFSSGSSGEGLVRCRHYRRLG